VRLRITMFKSIAFVVVLLAAITFAKEESNSKKKEEVGTVIGIDLGVSALDSTERSSQMAGSFLDNLLVRWHLQEWPCGNYC
jgi:hypothetical protein